MPLGRHNRLCNEHLVTNGAMLTLGQTGLGTGRRDSRVGDLGVSLLLNNRLRDGYSTAHGTMLTLGQAGRGTSCLYRCVGDLGVTGGINRGILIRITTNRASVSGIAVNRTGRSSYDSVVGVTLSSNRLGLDITALRTSLSLHALSQAFGSKSHFFIIGVPQLRLLYVSSVVATRAGHVCIPADFSTGGILCLVRNLIMTQGISLSFLGRTVTSGAVARFSSLFGTSCCRIGCPFSRIIVTLCRNNRLRDKGYITYRAMRAFGQAGRSTGRCDCRVGSCSMIRAVPFTIFIVVRISTGRKERTVSVFQLCRGYIR